MRIKVNDKVKITAGKDRGKQGKVLQCFPSEGKIVVDKVNKLIKHLKPQKSGEKGQRVEFFAPLNVSNAMLICPDCKKTTRVGYKIVSGKKKQRVCKKCKVVIDK